MIKQIFGLYSGQFCSLKFSQVAETTYIKFRPRIDAANELFTFQLRCFISTTESLKVNWIKNPGKISHFHFWKIRDGWTKCLRLGFKFILLWPSLWYLLVWGRYAGLKMQYFLAARFSSGNFVYISSQSWGWLLSIWNGDRRIIW